MIGESGARRRVSLRRGEGFPRVAACRTASLPGLLFAAMYSLPITIRPVLPAIPVSKSDTALRSSAVVWQVFGQIIDC